MLYTTTYGVWDFPTEADDIVKMEGVYSGSSIHEAGKNEKVLQLTTELVVWRKIKSKNVDTPFNNSHNYLSTCF